MMFDSRAIRNRSLDISRERGYTVNPNLPLLEQPIERHSNREISARSLSLYACVASAYGLPKLQAKKWLSTEGFIDSLAPSERMFLVEDVGHTVDYQWQVETLWALTWGAQHHSDYDAFKSCRNDFIFIFPDIKKMESSRIFCGRTQLRPLRDLVDALDLVYCLHWIARQQQISGVSGDLHVTVIRNRRHALEWLVYGQEWDEIELDT